MVPDLWEIECNADLLLINSYEVLGNVRPSVPTTVYLGGIHQQTNDRTMSPSLKQFIDESENIIYVNIFRTACIIPVGSIAKHVQKAIMVTLINLVNLVHVPRQTETLQEDVTYQNLL